MPCLCSANSRWDTESHSTTVEQSYASTIKIWTASLTLLNGSTQCSAALTKQRGGQAAYPTSERSA